MHRIFPLTASLAASLLACGGAVDSADAGPTPDTWVATDAPTCLDVPHFDVRFIPLVMPHDPGESDAVPAHVYASLTGCNLPPVDVAAEADPHLTVALDTDHTILTQSPGYLGTLGVELTPKMSGLVTPAASVGGSLLSSKWVASFPEWSASTPTILVLMSYLDTDPAECRVLDGWSVHGTGAAAGLHVTMLGDARPYLPTTASVTTASGLAVVSGLPAGARVTLVTEHPGCASKTFVTSPLGNGLVTLTGPLGDRGHPL